MEVNESGAEPSPKRTRSLSAGGRRPNFFVAIQVTNPEIHRSVRVVQNLVITKKHLFKSVLIKLITLHITLCTLSLQGIDEIERTKKALKKLEQDVKEKLIKNPVNLKFKGIGSFKNEVVFAKVEAGESLTMVKSVHVGLLKALVDEGLVVADDFSPHLTIMKMSRDKSLRKKRIFKIPKDLYEEKSDLEFGDQIVRSIQLLSIGDHAENAYYNCYHSIDLGTSDETECHIECCGVQSVVPSKVIELPPQEKIQAETTSSESIKIIDSDVGGKELFYRAGTSENNVPKSGEVTLKPVAAEAEIKISVPSKPEEGISSALNTAAGEDRTPAVIKVVESGQGDGGILEPVSDKTVSKETEIPSVIDGIEKSSSPK